MIRKAEETDLPRIFELFAVARVYMKATGNGTQWGDTKPEESAIREHLSKGNLYVVVLENIIEAVFAMVPGQDPTYAYIEDGQWPNEESYVTLHAVASSGNRKGMFHLISVFAKETSANVRIDTHEKMVLCSIVSKRKAFCTAVSFIWQMKIPEWPTSGVQV